MEGLQVIQNEFTCDVASHRKSNYIKYRKSNAIYGI